MATFSTVWVTILTKVNRNKRCSRVLKAKKKNHDIDVSGAALLDIVKVEENDFFVFFFTKLWSAMLAHIRHVTLQQQNFSLYQILRA